MAAMGSPLLMCGSHSAQAQSTVEETRVDRYYQTMGSIASVTIFGPDRKFCMAAAAEACAAMRLVDGMMSSFTADSVLNLVNRAAGRNAVAVPPELLRVVRQAGGIWRATTGKFDITVGPLLELYGFFSRGTAGRYPSDKRIARTLDAVGFQNVEIDETAGTIGLTREGARIDLGGIAVGFALDLAGASLRARGVRNALINHSGDILALGAPPGLPGWEIGIQDPVNTRGTIRTLTLRDASVSTSGNYENFKKFDQRIIGHILNPRSGVSTSRYLSISVIADSSIVADALATGVFAGGTPILDGEDWALNNSSIYAVEAGPDGPVAGFLMDRRAPEN